MLALWALYMSARICAAGWVDSDSPASSRRTRSLVDGESYDLVFSDEFNTPGRRFDDGSDPRWTAIHKNDYTNKALHYYHRDCATTNGGRLNLTTTSQDTKFTSNQVKDKKRIRVKLAKHYRSGMLQTWNKFCFTGGILEIRAKLPGRHDVGGLWPAMWLLGNLARSTYVDSSDFIWPWSWDKCDRKMQGEQKINACGPQPHYGLHPEQGRGAPEIDLLEVMPGSGGLPWGMTKPYFSTSFQVAPGKPSPRPQNGNMPAPGTWYEGMEYSKKLNTSINVFFYGTTLDHGPDTYTADAISANTPIGKTHFDDLHTYRVEWDPRSTGGMRWFLDDQFIYSIEAASLAVTGAKVPDEPMYVLLNTALSSTWGFPAPCPPGCKCDCFDCKDPACACAISPGFCETLPAAFLIDSVRVYQNLKDPAQKVGCSTDTHPSKKYIEGHKIHYSDPDSDFNDPLRPIQTGGAKCIKDADCGKGRCHERRACACLPGASGPNCRAPTGFDDVDYEATPPLVVSGLYLPPPLLRAAICIAALFLCLVALTRLKLKKAPP
ncbi:beta-glucan synthesis-associated protein-domain-containing protein [Pelagophyceae sp. CCMP2097]|nr:beta-glucan synthesis-associated protein-domain-containing protein [Pelagophyceae sp. CCMP2097]|mmetsp:Transcript_11911/g.41159  ORF Transcript_11911/g.41159 Transcript_11911/m.41159 type:complete len:548 (+) Transcript_11911:139-1782(+)